MTQTTINRSGYDKNYTYYECNIDTDSVPTIFIHGVGLDISMWSQQKKLFKKNYLFYDLINHGKTKKNKKKLKYEDFNIQLKELLKFFNIKKINLIGFSIGSIIALNFSTKYKEIVNKLILISSVYNRSLNEKKMVLSRYKIAKKGGSISNLAIKRWFTKKFLNKNPNVNNFFFNLLEKNKNENFLPAYKLFANSNNQKFDFKKFNIPTLLITGEKDSNSTPEMSSKLSKKIKKSKLKIISNARHMAIYENAIIINTEIKKFLK